MSWRTITPYFKNAEFIFPTQQRDVLKIVNTVKLDANIRRVIIFGSSVTSACNPWSDVDVYFELDKDKRLPVFGLENSLDAWTNFSVDKELLSSILDTGVTVYERDVI